MKKLHVSQSLRKSGLFRLNEYKEIVKTNKSQSLRKSGLFRRMMNFI